MAGHSIWVVCCLNRFFQMKPMNCCQSTTAQPPNSMPLTSLSMTGAPPSRDHLATHRRGPFGLSLTTTIRTWDRSRQLLCWREKQEGTDREERKKIGDGEEKTGTEGRDKVCVSVCEKIWTEEWCYVQQFYAVLCNSSAYHYFTSLCRWFCCEYCGDELVEEEDALQGHCISFFRFIF